MIFYKVNKQLEIIEVDVVSVTSKRVRIQDLNGKKRFESLTSHYWGYSYFSTEQMAIEYILQEVMNRLSLLRSEESRLIIIHEKHYP